MIFKRGGRRSNFFTLLPLQSWILLEVFAGNADLFSINNSNFPTELCDISQTPPSLAKMGPAV